MDFETFLSERNLYGEMMKTIYIKREEYSLVGERLPL
jgi:hypothetical protein